MRITGRNSISVGSVAFQGLGIPPAGVVVLVEAWVEVNSSCGLFVNGMWLGNINEKVCRVAHLELSLVLLLTVKEA